MSLNEQMEMTGEGTRPHSRPAKRCLWGGLRQQWRLLGLFEIGPQHEFYDLTCMMKEGLQASVQNTIDNPPPDELSEEDFEMEVTQIHESFRMETFAGPVFAWLRRSLGMSERDYQQSLATTQGCYLQFISNSKSKADFFLTPDPVPDLPAPPSTDPPVCSSLCVPVPCLFVGLIFLASTSIPGS